MEGATQLHPTPSGVTEGATILRQTKAQGRTAAGDSQPLLQHGRQPSGENGSVDALAKQLSKKVDNSRLWQSPMEDLARIAFVARAAHMWALEMLLGATEGKLERLFGNFRLG